MDGIKFMCIYMDNSCEVHYDSADNSKLILSPCGSEFVYRTYTDNVIKNTLKYRTAYAISIFSSKLQTILKIRNKLCFDQPFISPILLEQEKQFWFSSEDLSFGKWNTTPMTLNIKNPIELDYNNCSYTWKSDCKNVKVMLHFNRKLFTVIYPIKVPIYENDEYEQNCENFNRFKTKNNKMPVSKHIFKFTWAEQEFSANHLPLEWKNLYSFMSKLVDEILNEKNENSTKQLNILDDNNLSAKKSSIEVKLPDAMPLSCKSTHLHRFDDIEIISEQKVIYMEKTWYNLFYKNKSIEIVCPVENSESNHEKHFETDQIETNNSQIYPSNYDYLISDTLSGRYFSCYSMNKRNYNVENVKICTDNIPSFKIHLKKIMSYAQIFLKRIDSVKTVSNYSSCNINKKFKKDEFCHQNDTNIPCIKIEHITANSTKTNLSDDKGSSFAPKSTDSNIKKQFVIENVGHFKCLENNTILIHFFDKVKLYMNESSFKLFMHNDMNKCSCWIYLPDNSEHEVFLGDSYASTSCFNNYVKFLSQWLNWLIETNALVESQSTLKNKFIDNEVNLSTMQAHLSNLKLFNYTMQQKTTFEDIQNKDENKWTDSNALPLSNLLKENKDFLKNISEQR